MERSGQSLTDKQLLDGFIREGREESLNLLVQRHKLRLFNLAFRVLHDKHAAEEVVQQAFIQFVKDKNQLTNVQSPQSWLYATALHLSLNVQDKMKRRKKREQATETASAPETPREAAIRAELRKELDSALALLKRSVRVPIVLRYLLGLSYAEAGEVMDLSSDTVRKRVKKGLKLLRKRLTARGLVVTAVAVEAGLRTIPAKAASASFLPSASSIIKAASATSVTAKAAVMFTSVTKGATIMAAKSKIGIAAAVAILLGITAHFAMKKTDKGDTTSPPFPSQTAPAQKKVSVQRPREHGVSRHVIHTESTEGIEPVGVAEDYDISGIVIDEVGNPMEGAVVDATFHVRSGPVTDNNRLRYTTREDGKFGFTHPEARRCTLWVWKDDYIGVEQNFAFPQKDIVITLTLGGAIEGNVVDAMTLEPLDRFRIVYSVDIGALAGPDFLNENREVEIHVSMEGKEFKDPEGRFRLSGLLEYTYVVTSLAEGYAQSSAAGINVELGKTTTGVVIRQQPSAGIRGRVVDAMGKLIEGAEIMQKAPPGLFGAFEEKSLATSDPKGEFEILGLPEGRFTLQARHRDYGPAEQRVSVKKGETTEGVEFQLLQGGMISGVVLAKADLHPVAGATVKASIGPPTLMPTVRGTEAKTDQNGLFEIIDLQPGTYSLTVSAPDFAQEVMQDIKLERNDLVTDLVIQLSRGGSLVGTVQDSTGNPMANLIVVAASGADGSKSALTDEKGNYAIPNLKEGAYAAGVLDTSQMPGTGARGMSGPEMHFVKIENDKETRLDIVIGKPLTVYGKVTLSGEPQPGLEIVIAAATTAKFGFATTDDAGRYEIRKIQAGKYDLVVLKADGRGSSGLFQTQIELSDEDLEKNIELPQGAISGRVVDMETGNPIEGAEVTLQPRRTRNGRETALSMLDISWGWSEGTDSSGSYRFLTVEDGAYFIVGRKEGYAPQSVSAEVRNSQGPSDLDLSLSTGVTLSGQVIGSDPSQPVHEIFLSARDSNGAIVYSSKISLTPQGEYQTAALSPGRYTISVEGKGYAPATMNVRIAAGADNRSDLVLLAGGTLIVRAIDDRGNPVPGARGKLLHEEGNYWRPAFRPHVEDTREVGVTMTPNISEGKYRVEVSAFGYENELLNVTIREGETSDETVRLRKSR